MHPKQRLDYWNKVKNDPENLDKDKLVQLNAGNDKLPFWQWSLPCVATCPASTQFCRRYCYSLKAWGGRQWKAVQPRQLENFVMTKRKDFVDKMTKEVLDKTKVGEKVVRVHVDGDFYDQEYLDKWKQVAKNIFEKDKAVRFVAYTKNSVLDFSNMPKNFKVIFSEAPDYDVQETRHENIPAYDEKGKEVMEIRKDPDTKKEFPSQYKVPIYDKEPTDKPAVQKQRKGVPLYDAQGNPIMDIPRAKNKIYDVHVEGTTPEAVMRNHLFDGSAVMIPPGQSTQDVLNGMAEKVLKERGDDIQHDEQGHMILNDEQKAFLHMHNVGPSDALTYWRCPGHCGNPYVEPGDPSRGCNYCFLTLDERRDYLPPNFRSGNVAFHLH
jgi:hypothetical protein